MKDRSYLFLVVFSLAASLPLFGWVYPTFYEWMDSPTNDWGTRTVSIAMYSLGIFYSLFLAGQTIRYWAKDANESYLINIKARNYDRSRKQDFPDMP